jgi:hypothetical protein
MTYGLSVLNIRLVILTEPKIGPTVAVTFSTSSIRMLITSAVFQKARFVTVSLALSIVRVSEKIWKTVVAEARTSLDPSMA